MFKAILLEESDGKVSAEVTELDESELPEAEVTVAVEYSTLNYKDGMVLNGLGRLVRNYPHVPGVDFAGTVEASSDAAFKPGDKVILTGWRVGEQHWGGYAEKARVRADWLVPLPEGLTTKRAMAIGTAGFTAMLAVMALEAHGVAPDGGEVLVTGAAGGVGSVAVALLHKLGYKVTASTGRAETHDYLRISAPRRSSTARKSPRRAAGRWTRRAGRAASPPSAARRWPACCRRSLTAARSPRSASPVATSSIPP